MEAGVKCTIESNDFQYKHFDIDETFQLNCCLIFTPFLFVLSFQFDGNGTIPTKPKELNVFYFYYCYMLLAFCLCHIFFPLLVNMLGWQTILIRQALL